MSHRLINFAIRAPLAIAMRFRIMRLRMLGMQIGPRCWLRKISVPRNPWDISLAEHVALDDGVILLTSGARGVRPRLRIGPGVYVNRNVMMDVSEELTIGGDTMIGPFVYITDHDHGTEPGKRLGDQALVCKPTHIGCNVWIGAHAVILKGVKIGDNAVVGAGAVVTKDVPSGTIATGVPAGVRERSGSSRREIAARS
jgi:maltose O-acetyltransferase